MGSLSAANTKFCLDFFKELSKVKRNKNIFFSPLSISAALSMVQLGAGGNTAEEMEKVLHIDEVLSMASPGTKSTTGKCEEAREAHSQFQELLSALGKTGATCSLSIANRLFGEVTFQFLQQYLDSTRALYHAELEAVDFINAAEESRGKMNSWVEKQTSGKIKGLFPPGSIDCTTVLALVNAIHFKGQWAIKFEEKNTREMPFRLNKGKSLPGSGVGAQFIQAKYLHPVKWESSILFPSASLTEVMRRQALREHRNVPMMCRTGKYKLARRQEEQMAVLELPYTGQELSMFILLPENICDESTGLEQLESAVTYEKLAEWTNMENVYPQKITVYLPQFRMEESYELMSVLQALGMRDAFVLHQADFSGLSRKPGLFLSKAIHKSFVEVNEEGTEAAAATGMTIIPLCLHIPYEFRTDHPFLFLIKHNPTKNILFFGRCCSP